MDTRFRGVAEAVVAVDCVRRGETGFGACGNGSWKPGGGAETECLRLRVYEPMGRIGGGKT